MYADYEPPTKQKEMLDFFTSIGNIFKQYMFVDGSQLTKLNNVTEFEEEFKNGGFYSVNVTGISPRMGLV